MINSREGRIRNTVPVFFEINSRVINGHQIANEGCLLHPQERTCSVSEPMSAKCRLCCKSLIQHIRNLRL